MFFLLWSSAPTSPVRHDYSDGRFRHDPYGPLCLTNAHEPNVLEPFSAILPICQKQPPMIYTIKFLIEKKDYETAFVLINENRIGFVRDNLLNRGKMGKIDYYLREDYILEALAKIEEYLKEKPQAFSLLIKKIACLVRLNRDSEARDTIVFTMMLSRGWTYGWCLFFLAKIEEDLDLKMILLNETILKKDKDSVAFAAHEMLLEFRDKMKESEIQKCEELSDFYSDYMIIPLYFFC